MKKDLLIDILKLYKVKQVDIKNVATSDLNERVGKIYVINMIQDILNRNYIIVLMKRLRIAVLRGGPSSEFEVSLNSEIM